MKALITTLIIIFSSHLTFSQEGEKKEIFDLVEDMPIFPSCAKKKSKVKRESCTNYEIQMFVVKNVRFPSSQFGKGLSGTSYVQYVINKQGIVDQIKIVKGFDHKEGYLFDEEAIKVIKKLPKFLPAMTKGIPQKVQYTMPIRFSEK